MLIQKSKIRNVSVYLAHVPTGSAFRAVVALTPQRLQRLSRLGLPDTPMSGDTVLPKPYGPVSGFNANGAWKIHRHKPKERRYVRTVSWRWKQWAGRGQTEEHEEFRDIYRDCYQRSFVEPYGVELTYVDHCGRKLLVSPSLTNNQATADRNAHTINLLLEFAGECEVVRDDLSQFVPVSTRRVHWQMLPHGLHPWNRVYTHLKDVLKSTSDNTQRVILDRQATIMNLSPDEQYVGLGGFHDYIAYVFTTKGVVMLESIRRGNAIYVFGNDWKKFSQLTKAEVLSNKHHFARIIHAGGWKAAVARILEKHDAA